MSTDQDMYAGASETTEGRVFTVTGQDWDAISEGLAEEAEERVVVNMGPQHPSTHGVLRLILELEGETVTDARCGIGYLHTGIEKNMEFRTWTQGVTFCTRMDYLSPFYNEATYVLGVERLLDIEDDVPEKAQVMRVLLMELNRLSSHLVAIATGGMEIGALTVMTVGFRERELVLDLFELITGLRMNHAFIRPGGVAQDLPVGALEEIRSFIALMKKRLPEYAALCNANPIFKARLEGVGHLDLEGCMALGLTGPVLRSTGYPWDLRKTQPYCGYEDYEFDVQTWDTADAYGRFRVRLAEMWESLRIVEQAADRLAGLEGAPGDLTTDTGGAAGDQPAARSGGRRHHSVPSGSRRRYAARRSASWVARSALERRRRCGSSRSRSARSITRPVAARSGRGPPSGNSAIRSVRMPSRRPSVSSQLCTPGSSGERT